jgi:hypothetical protein
VAQVIYSARALENLERAAALLRNTDRSVADICLTVGLRSVGSFTTSFGRAYGMSPTAYRARFPPAAKYQSMLLTSHAVWTAGTIVSPMASLPLRIFH